MKKLKKHDINRQLELIRPELVLFANNILRDRFQAEDIVQDIYIYIINVTPRFENTEHLSSYCYRSIKNKCNNIFKSKQYKLKTPIDGFDLIDEVKEKQSIDFNKVFELLYDKANLPNKMNQIIKLQMKNLTNLEIADIMGVSINTVKDSKKRAYEKLRATMHPLLKYV